MLHAQTRLSHPDGVRAMAQFAADHSEYIFGGPDGPWDMPLSLGRLRVHRDGDGLAVLADGVNPIGLSYIKLIFVDHIREYLAQEVEFQWQGDGQTEGLPPFFRQATVTALRRVTPAVQRVTLDVPDLQALPMDELHVRLLLPLRNRRADLPPVWPVLTASGALSFPKDDDALMVRVYTIRTVDLARGQVEIDFVLHQTDADSAANWAASCRPGDVAGLLGPGGGPLPAAPHLLLLGDETALPAIARILESVPDSTRCDTIIEVDGPDDEQTLARPVEWLHRRGAAPGTTDMLAQALARRQPVDGLYVWAGCEFAAFRALRRHVRSDWKLPRNRHMITAYWRRGVDGEIAEEPHHTPPS